MKRPVLCLALAFVSSAVLCQDELRDAQEQVKAQLAGYSELQFQRLTSEGVFTGCQLTYTHVFRDFKARQGDLVVANGSIFSAYTPDKVFNLGLKLKTSELEVVPNPPPPKPFQPAYARLSLAEPLDRFRTTQFVCEGGGICIGYADNRDFDLMRATITQMLEPGPSITVTTAKGGLDYTFSILKFAQGKESQSLENDKALIDFYQCLGEIPKLIQKYLQGQR